MMKLLKLILILLCFNLLLLPVKAAGTTANSNGSYTLKAGVSVIDSVPNTFYGNWRVVSKLQRTNAPAKFNSSSVDLWNLSREGDVLNLSNPFTGASASLTLSQASDSNIKFTRVSEVQNNQRVTEVVELNLNKDYFTGTNTWYWQVMSDVNGQIVSTYTARYSVRGEKLSGMSIF